MAQITGVKNFGENVNSNVSSGHIKVQNQSNTGSTMEKKKPQPPIPPVAPKKDAAPPRATATPDMFYSKKDNGEVEDMEEPNHPD